ncbi:MAG: hypothetical protein BWY54_00201 [Candidatus Dependentiae bacterium ADurb.Bin331]|nr:MAG: hypothetical protein BWY54_00201 [Candidatus Dependentiae bacterium ADurb.Bin331]
MHNKYRTKFLIFTLLCSNTFSTHPMDHKLSLIENSQIIKTDAKMEVDSITKKLCSIIIDPTTQTNEEPPKTITEEFRSLENQLNNVLNSTFFLGIVIGAFVIQQISAQFKNFCN